MAEPVYPIYPLQEETAAVQKFLADKKAYEAIAANLPAIEEKIARQQQIAKTGYSIQPPTLLESVSGFFIPRRVYSPEAQEQAILSIRDLEAQKAAIQNAQPPDLSSVRQAAFAPELPPGVAEIVASNTQAQDKPTPTPAPAAPEAAPAQEQKQPDQFSEFTNFIKKRDETRARAIAYVKKNFPREDLIDGLEMVQKMTDEYFPAPRNIAQPIIDQFTGKPLEGYALIGGKVEKVEKPKVEDDGRSVIGYEGKVPTQTEAIKFREQVSDINSGVSALDELIQLGRKGSSLSPTDRARAQNLARMIQGKFRLEIVGPGAVTENDRKVLEDVVASPLDIFRLSDVPTLLTDMKSRMLSARDEKARSLGLKPTGQPSQPSQGGGGVVNRMRFDTSGKRIQ